MWLTLGLIIGLAVMAVLFTTADRAVRQIAERRTAIDVKKELGFRRKPVVSFEGFPFLTQLLRRRFREIHIAGRRIETGEIPIAHLNLTLRGVRLRDDGMNVHRLDGTVVITFTDLVLAGGRRWLTLTADGEDQVRISALLNVTALKIPVWTRATSRITLLDGNRIQIRIVSLDLLPSRLHARASELLDFTVPIEDLPPGLTLTGIRTTARGVELTLSGRDMNLA